MLQFNKATVAQKQKIKSASPTERFADFGATDPIRTDDLLITSELLYLLSHSSISLIACLLYQTAAV